MSTFSRGPRWLFRLLHWPPRLAYALGLGRLIGAGVLLLTTTGRKTGRPRVTPLQYEVIDGMICLGAALGGRADWLRNIQADPRVTVRVKSRSISGTAEWSLDPERVADFLELRLARHPRLVGLLLRAEGLQPSPERADLVRYAAGLAVVVIRPDQPLNGRGETPDWWDAGNPRRSPAEPEGRST